MPKQIVSLTGAALLAFGCLGLCQPVGAAEGDPCAAVLDRAAHNVQRNVGQSDRLAYAYQKLCKEARSSGSSGEDLEFNILVAEIPIGVKGSGDRDKKTIKNWCDDNKRLEREEFKFDLFQSQVVDMAIQAWQECKASHSSGVLMVPLISESATVVDINVTNKGGHNQVLRPILVDGEAHCCVQTDHLSCEGQEEQSTTQVDLEPSKTANVHCSRKRRTHEDGISRYEYLPEATISLSTAATPRPFQLTLPRVNFPPQYILSKEAEKLRSDLEGLKECAAPKTFCRCAYDGGTKVGRVEICLEVCPDGRIQDFEISSFHLSSGAKNCQARKDSPLKPKPTAP